MGHPIRGLEGNRFGKLTAIEEVKTKKGHVNWKCLCECGKYCVKRGSSLVSGHTISCGCATHVSKNVKDITGVRYSSLVVIKRLPSQERKQSSWLCLCDCGNECIRRGTALRYGSSISCGCLQSIGQNPNYLKSCTKWLIRMYSGGAKSRNLSFKLSDEEFMKIAQNPCHYCGFNGRDWGALWFAEKLRRIEIKTTARCDLRADSFSLIANGIDRLRNDEGYSPDNCVPCCATCNFMKKDMTEQNFLAHIAEIHSYRLLPKN